MDPIPNSARWGSLLGCTLWAPLLGVNLALAGEPMLGLHAGLIGTACGVGLGQLTLRATTACQVPGERMRVLWGGLLVTFGVLLLLWSFALLPLLEGSPQAVDHLQRVTAMPVIPAWLCGLPIAIGAWLLRQGRPRGNP